MTFACRYCGQSPVGETGACARCHARRETSAPAPALLIPPRKQALARKWIDSAEMCISDGFPEEAVAWYRLVIELYHNTPEEDTRNGQHAGPVPPPGN